jgi:hypothetical protein
MAQQNKSISNGARVSELESELTAKAADAPAMDAEAGHDYVQDPFKVKMNRRNSIFMAQQGHRQRHPLSVLGRYHGLITTTDTASTVVEAAMEHEHRRSQIPKEYTPSEIGMGLSTMYHVEDVARANFKQSKKKLATMHLVGV